MEAVLVASEAMDWKAAADAAAARRAELNLTQEQLIDKMGEMAIHIEAYRRFERGEQAAYRRRTLATISVALDWPADHLWAIAEGRAPQAPDEISELREQMAGLVKMVDLIAERVAQIEAAVQPAPKSKPRPARGR